MGKKLFGWLGFLMVNLGEFGGFLKWVFLLSSIKGLQSGRN